MVVVCTKKKINLGQKKNWQQSSKDDNDSDQPERQTDRQKKNLDL